MKKVYVYSKSLFHEHLMDRYRVDVDEKNYRRKDGGCGSKGCVCGYPLGKHVEKKVGLTLAVPIDMVENGRYTFNPGHALALTHLGSEAHLIHQTLIVGESIIGVVG